MLLFVVERTFNNKQQLTKIFSDRAKGFFLYDGCLFFEPYITSSRCFLSVKAAQLGFVACGLTLPNPHPPQQPDQEPSLTSAHGSRR